MKRILVTGAGGSPSVNFTRSLRQAPDDYHLVGTDADKYYLQRAEVDARYLVPPAGHPQYIEFLNYVIDTEQVDFVHAQNDVEIAFLSENREKLHARVFLPAKRTVRILQDKYESFKIWKAAGIKVPRTILIDKSTDLARLLDDLDGAMWIRAITGSGGRGSLPVHDVRSAANWLDFHESNGAWAGNFMAAELLEPETVTWMSVWKDGELLAAQGRKRLFWELAKLSPSGVTGVTGAGISYADPELTELAQRAVRSVDSRPTGLFGVDMAYDRNGEPNVTEINVGRFFTTHHFFTAAGLNLPQIFVRAAFDEDAAPAERTNPLPDGLVWIRGMDFEPVLTDLATIEASVEQREAILARL